LALPTQIAQAAGPLLGALALAYVGVTGTLVGISALALVNLVLACVLRAALPTRAQAAPAAVSGD